MNRTPDEQLIYDALSRVATPPCDIERAVRRRRAVRPHPAKTANENPVEQA